MKIPVNQVAVNRRLLLRHTSNGATRQRRTFDMLNNDLNRIQPEGMPRQPDQHELHPGAGGEHLPIVRPLPRLHGPRPLPGGGVPYQDEPAMASCRMHRQAFFEERDGLYAVRVGGVPPGDPVFLALQAQVGTPGLAAFLATGRIHRRLSRGRPPGSGFRIEQALGRHPDEPGLIEVVQPARWVG